MRAWRLLSMAETLQTAKLLLSLPHADITEVTCSYSTMHDSEGEYPFAFFDEHDEEELEYRMN